MTVYVTSEHDTTMVNDDIAELMTLTLIHDGGGVAKFTPAIDGKVWYDTYFKGASVFHSAIDTNIVADVMMELMDKGYYVAR